MTQSLIIECKDCMDFKHLYFFNIIIIIIIIIKRTKELQNAIKEINNGSIKEESSVC